jgi:hypothetical protein
MGVIRYGCFAITVCLGFMSEASATCIVLDKLGSNPPQCVFDPMPGLPQISQSGVTVTASPRPHCEEGWVLVDQTQLRPMCAKQLKEPEYR